MKTALLFSTSANSFSHFPIISEYAFLSISSLKLYWLHIKLSFEVEVFEFKSSSIIHQESFSIHLITSSAFRLFQELIFSRS
ncbi:MAG: hypothetical protein PHD79_09430 [Aliarcobacter sp.]|nr:hypothetical protein [Aliarcobacter sp.]